MEKRFVSFLIVAAAILVTSQMVAVWLNPEPELVDNKPDAAEVKPDDVQPDQGEVDPDDADLSTEAPESPSDDGPAAPADNDQAEIEALPGANTQQWPTAGSLDRDSPYKMAVWFNTRGASIECIALNDHWYDLEDQSGYLGYLALTDGDAGCRINAVAAGTPAALATSTTPGISPGLRVGDVITRLNEQAIRNKEDFRLALSNTRPDQTVETTVRRDGNEVVFSAALVRRPLEIIRPEPEIATPEDPRHPMSYLTSLNQLGNLSVAFGEQNIKGLPSLRDENWSAKPLDDAKGSGVEFRFVIPAGTVPELTDDLVIVKRYRVARAPDKPEEGVVPRLYHLTLELEFVYKGDEPLKLAYHQDGPTGLPLEGWWYTFKTHPTRFGGAGMRDIVVRAFGGGHKMFTNPKIVKRAEEHPEAPATQTLPPEEEQQTQLQYACVDAQYFTSGLVADAAEDDPEATARYEFAKVWAMPVAPKNQEKATKTNVSFRLESLPITVSADGYKQDFLVFAGPKRPDVLAQYGLQDSITYGWFPLIAKPLTAVLHFFYSIFGNFGIAIILMTVLVRGCMFPLGRQQALNAQKMQDLAPEMKRIAEKYKDNMEKRAEAQRELFRKNNYNPLAGCLPMFIQLPIFIGLYRALSVDIALRHSPLIPGLQWCSNLAGPDRLWYWEPFMPAMLASPTGWLGPYLNILPLISVAFMMVHQKLFTPPPTDEQQEMQHKIMKFMMIFFGFMFFRVPAGLCLYFITSSAWGLAERKLLPKAKKKTDADGTEKKQSSTMLSKLGIKKEPDSNGASNIAERRRQRQKRR